MHNVSLAAVTLVGVSLLVACDDGTPGTASPADPAATSAAASAEETIPDGTYAKTATTAEARAVGVTNKEFLRELGNDGETTYALKVTGNRWTLFVIEDGAAPEPGDLGTLEYDDNGDVDMVSGSPGCSQCVYTYDWRLTGDALS